MSTVNLFPWSPYITPADQQSFDSGATALVRAPVCPRCLDMTPGTSYGDPDVPHPGPFTVDVCKACHVNIEARQ